jgi:hypothetical protein
MGAALALVVLSRRNLTLTLLIFMGQIVSLRAGEPHKGAARDPWVPELVIEKYRLANGLTVVLHEDHKAPLVAIDVSYNVGSKDDPPGRPGFAHLFEHLLKMSSRGCSITQIILTPGPTWGRSNRSGRSISRMSWRSITGTSCLAIPRWSSSQPYVKKWVVRMDSSPASLGEKALPRWC